MPSTTSCTPALHDLGQHALDEVEALLEARRVTMAMMRRVRRFVQAELALEGGLVDRLSRQRYRRCR